MSVERKVVGACYAQAYEDDPGNSLRMQRANAELTEILREAREDGWQEYARHNYSSAGPFGITLYHFTVKLRREHTDE